MTLLDVRSPGEFAKGHMPRALNFPIFTDKERAKVGTTYKQVGQQEAFDLGLKIVGPKMAQMVQEARELCPDQRAEVYCWRGDLRSQAVASLLQWAGFEVTRREGGYKAYRRWVHTTLDEPRQLKILGGMTGSGKTEKLHELAAEGEQIIDLEALANHRGSSFGMIGQPPQPTQEQFENLLAAELSEKGHGPLWVEDESRMIGTCKLPDIFFQMMDRAPLYIVECSEEERLTRLEKGYGTLPRSELIEAICRLQRRLGSERANAAIECLKEGEIRKAIQLLLYYYDKTYQHCISRRKGPIEPLADQMAGIEG